MSLPFVVGLPGALRLARFRRHHRHIRGSDAVKRFCERLNRPGWGSGENATAANSAFHDLDDAPLSGVAWGARRSSRRQEVGKEADPRRESVTLYKHNNAEESSAMQKITPVFDWSRQKFHKICTRQPPLGHVPTLFASDSAAGYLETAQQHLQCPVELLADLLFSFSLMQTGV